MAKIFVSYSNKDRDYVLAITAELKDLGHEIIVDVDALSPGQNWQRTLSDGLKSADVFVVFLSDNSLHSQFVLSEIGSARAYANQSDQMLVVPVLIEDIKVPPVIQDLLVIEAPGRSVHEIVQSIEGAIASFFGRRAAKEEEQVAISRLIEANSAEYIEEAIGLLGRLEARNRRFGVAWYVAGFVALIFGISFGAFGVSRIAAVAEKGWLDFALLALKSVVVVGLLGACSRYAFTLGRSYISESLKSADRMHAISFGKFYLRVYGAKATWPEVKEVFQHWNIDRSSSFTNLTTSEFDPKILESFVEMVKALSSRNPNEKRA
jgi:hypothetical protein